MGHRICICHHLAERGGGKFQKGCLMLLQCSPEPSPSVLPFGRGSSAVSQSCAGPLCRSPGLAEGRRG